MVFSLMQNAVLLTLFLVILFTLRFGAAWLLPAAIVLDAYYGGFTGVPGISLVALVWFVASELVRPQLRLV